MHEKFLNPTQDSGRDFLLREISGSVVMLNLLHFRKVADYSESPHLAPGHPISGEQAYQLYMEATLPFLSASGGEILFMGKGGRYLIGPQDEQWDVIMLIKQKSVDSFMQFASNPEYLQILGHRSAALEDSRLLPLEELSF